jgi:hypothetical protein
MTEEIWKFVPSFPDIQASNFGRIKLPETQSKMPNGGTRVYKTKPVLGTKRKAAKTALREYYGITSSKHGNLKVHRLVCEAFHGVPNSPNLFVLHIDENALNNKADNLKWGTQKENLNAPKFIEYCKSRTGEKNPFLKGKKK